MPYIQAIPTSLLCLKTQVCLQFLAKHRLIKIILEFISMG